MKKLIAIAAVVVAGSVFATDGYDFTATLKTTKGKQSGITTAQYKLGMDSSGAFWYEDETVSGTVTNNYQSFVATTNTDTKVINNHTVQSLKLVDKKGNVLATGAGYLANPNAELIAYIRVLAQKYNRPSNGQWCEIVKVEESGCYRVAGSAKIDVDLFTVDLFNTNCCSLLTTPLDVMVTNDVTVALTKRSKVLRDEFAYGDQTNVVVNYGIGFELVNRFGAINSQRANKVEALGWVDAPTTADGRWFTGDLAGQGSYSNGRLTTLSGNILGLMDPAVCPNCCTTPDPAIAFICEDDNPQGDLYTAAYGTFRLKYNSRLR